MDSKRHEKQFYNGVVYNARNIANATTKLPLYVKYNSIAHYTCEQKNAKLKYSYYYT
jgi:hypothetical protein